ncbi:MAG: hypothetical protein HY247_01540 [archaeon]|nr:MAG: hypothetical protein HY247_01540 [archaeon]
MAGRNSASAGIGASIYIACGLIAMASSQLLGSALSLSTDVFLQLGGETFLILILGFFLLVAGLLLDSKYDLRHDVAMALGALSALIGAIDSLLLLNLTGVLNARLVYGYSQIPEVGFFYNFLTVAVFVVVLAAFPLGMVGSLGMFHDESRSHDSQN